MTDIACIGECMIELRQAGNGLYSRGYGGDTLNTAVYLARLGTKVRYVTALGDDPLSDEMIAGWAGEGIETAHVIRLPGKLPGLYLIRTDDRGERQFFHWRESSAARGLMDLTETADILEALQNCKLVYFSAITLSIYGESGRRRLLAALRKARDGERPSSLTPISAPVAGRIWMQRAASIAMRLMRPTSCWPRRRICRRSIRMKATRMCWPASLAPKWC